MRIHYCYPVNRWCSVAFASGVLACILCLSIVLSAAVAEATDGMAEPSCFIRGIVLDSYGSGVPGAEVRLMTADGMWCKVPDNPALTKTSVPGEIGSFEFNDLSQQCYVLQALKDGYSGSVTLCPGEGGNYVEITLPGYVYVRPEQSMNDSMGSATESTLVFTGTSIAATGARPADTEHVLPEFWRLVLGGVVLSSGILLAAIVIKRR